jgi:hypothetical protein
LVNLAFHFVHLWLFRTHKIRRSMGSERGWSEIMGAWREYWTIRQILVIALIAWVLALTATWEFDLTGWKRDLLRMLPILLATVWIASARRRRRRAQRRN